jgi:hypothetical protein
MLGAPMGIDIDPSNMEDRAFRALATGPACAEQSAAFFAELHHGHRLAGVKDPTAIDWLPSVYHTVPDPVLVVVSRDVYAVAQREEACGSQFLDALHGAIRRKYAVLDFVERVADPLIVRPHADMPNDVNFVAARADYERECVVQLRRRRRFARWAS